MSTLVAYVLPGSDSERADEFLRAAVAFSDSYCYYAAGTDHELVVIIKGIPPKGVERHFPMGTTFVQHPPYDYDIGSWYRLACERPDAEWLMCLGAYCRILTDDWLAKLMAVAMTPGTGVVGVTGSFESGYSREPRNAHIRTSAFLLRTALLLSLNPRIANKRDCWEFEHGSRSMYRQCRDRGLRCPIVGADGRAYHEDDWADSYTFRRGEQHNTLIADHHYDRFAAATTDEQVELAAMAGWQP